MTWAGLFDPESSNHDARPPLIVSSVLSAVGIGPGYLVLSESAWMTW